MDVSFLEPVFAATGPFATVCADVTHTTENADTELDLRVRAVAERLTEQGAPETVVEAVRGRAVVVDSTGAVVLDQPLAGAPVREVAEWSAQPDLLPVLRQLAGRVPHVVVLIDRVGADITFVNLPEGADEQSSVEGDTSHIHKFQGGGWAHHRYQHNTENIWISNVDAVAQQIDAMVQRHSVQFVLVAGDVRARQILTDRAGSWGHLIVSMDEGGRAARASREPVDTREAELVAEHEARLISGTAEQVQAAAAHGLSVTGTDRVVEALRKGQVETLVLADDPEEGATLLVGGSPLELGVDQHDMDALGIHGTVVPADRALVQAALAGAAQVVVLPRAALPDEVPVAAVLRYTDDSTSSGQ